MTERTRIVYVLSGPEAAGPAGALVRLAKRLDRDRFTPAVVFPEEPGPGALGIQRAGAVVYSLDVPPEGTRRVTWQTLAAQRLVEFLRTCEADIVHALDGATSGLAAVAGRAARVPILIGSWRDHERTRPGWVRRGALRRLDEIVAPTEAAREQADAMLRGRHPPIVVVKDGIDAIEVQGYARLDEFSTPRHRVLTIARLVPGGAIEALLDAAARARRDVPDLEWLVSGAGPAGMRYLRAAESAGLGDCVRFLGEREDVGPLLASVDVFAWPGGAEALPSGLVQALAAGVPCVAVRNPSIAAVARDGEIACVGPGDAPALGAAVAEILIGERGRELRRRAQDIARRIASEHDADAAAVGFTALYERAIARCG